MEQFKQMINSSKFKKAISILLGLVAILFVFQLGMFVGFKKAAFSNRIGENYFREMRGGQNDFLLGFRAGDFINEHGAIGTIIQIKPSFIVVEDRDGDEKTVNISTSTQIKFMNDLKTKDDLKIDDFVVVFGAPRNATSTEIEARLIRIMPTSSNVFGGMHMMQ